MSQPIKSRRLPRFECVCKIMSRQNHLACRLAILLGAIFEYKTLSHPKVNSLVKICVPSAYGLKGIDLTEKQLCFKK